MGPPILEVLARSGIFLEKQEITAQIFDLSPESSKNTKHSECPSYFGWNFVFQEKNSLYVKVGLIEH